MISGEQREQQQQLEKRGCKVSHIPVFHECYRPTQARTAKIISYGSNYVVACLEKLRKAQHTKKNVKA